MIIFVGTFTLGCIDIETLQDTNIVHQHQYQCSKKPVVTQQVTVDDENGLAFTSRSIGDSDKGNQSDDLANSSSDGFYDSLRLPKMASGHQDKQRKTPRNTLQPYPEARLLRTSYWPPMLIAQYLSRAHATKRHRLASQHHIHYLHC
jgi:hypothetical protein